MGPGDGVCPTEPGGLERGEACGVVLLDDGKLLLAEPGADLNRVLGVLNNPDDTGDVEGVAALAA